MAYTNLGAREKKRYEQVFTSSGTWTRPAGVTAVDILAVGGGGPGGNGNTGWTGSGGGCGQVVEKKDVLVSGDLSITIGGSAGDTIVGSVLTALGGNPGVTGGLGGLAIPSPNVVAGDNGQVVMTTSTTNASGAVGAGCGGCSNYWTGSTWRSGLPGGPNPYSGFPAGSGNATGAGGVDGPGATGFGTSATVKGGGGNGGDRSASGGLGGPGYVKISWWGD